MKKIALFIALLFLFGSCATIITKDGGISSGPLLNVNDKYVGYAKGQAKIHEVLRHFDQVNIPSLILEAKLDMFRNRPLKANEYYSNFSVEFTYKYKFSIDRLKAISVVVGADILSQSDTTNFSTFVKNYANAGLPLEGKSKEFFRVKSDTFHLKEVVYGNIGDDLNEYDKFEIVFITDAAVELKYLDKGFATEKIMYNRYDFFSTSKVNKGFKSGDKAKLVSVYDKDKLTDAVVLGVSGKQILVSTEFGKFVVVPERLKK